MKRILVLLLESVTLFLSILWVIEEHVSVESLIVCIGAASTLLASIWLKTDGKQTRSGQDVTLQNSHRNVIVGKNKETVQINTYEK